MTSVQELRKQHICSARRIVVKVGTNVLAPDESLDDARVAGVTLAPIAHASREDQLAGCGLDGPGLAERLRCLLEEVGRTSPR